MRPEWAALPQKPAAKDLQIPLASIGSRASRAVHAGRRDLNTVQGRDGYDSATHENALPPRTPSFLNTMAAGQNPVIDAWIMLSPAKAVGRYQYGLTSQPSARPRSTTNPANI